MPRTPISFSSKSRLSAGNEANTRRQWAIWSWVDARGIRQTTRTTRTKQDVELKSTACSVSSAPRDAAAIRSRTPLYFSRASRQFHENFFVDPRVIGRNFNRKRNHTAGKSSVAPWSALVVPRGASVQFSAVTSVERESLKGGRH